MGYESVAGLSRRREPASSGLFLDGARRTKDSRIHLAADPISGYVIIGGIIALMLLVAPLAFGSVRRRAENRRHQSGAAGT